MSEASQTVSFRLPTTHARQLAKKCEELGRSPGEFARSVMLEALGGSRVEELHREVKELKDAVVELREDIALATTALLTRGGKAEVKEAEDWVRTNLRCAK